MKTWYKAVCDTHKEMCNLFVNNIQCTYHYLLDKDELINDWLAAHYGCKLRLIHHDLDLDECYNNEYVSVKETKSIYPTMHQTIHFPDQKTKELYNKSMEDIGFHVIETSPTIDIEEVKRRRFGSSNE